MCMCVFGSGCVSKLRVKFVPLISPLKLIALLGLIVLHCVSYGFILLHVCMYVCVHAYVCM